MAAWVHPDTWHQTPGVKVVIPGRLRVVAAVTKLHQRESLTTAWAGQRVDGAPYSPVDVPPGLQLGLEFYQIAVDVKRRVLDVTVGELPSIAHGHSAQREGGRKALMSHLIQLLLTVLIWLCLPMTMSAICEPAACLRHVTYVWNWYQTILEHATWHWSKRFCQ